MATPYHHVRTRQTNSNGTPGTEGGVPMLSGIAPIPRQWDLVHAGWETHLSLLYAVQTPYHCFRYSIGMWAGGGRIYYNLAPSGREILIITKDIQAFCANCNGNVGFRKLSITIDYKTQ